MKCCNFSIYSFIYGRIFTSSVLPLIMLSYIIQLIRMSLCLSQRRDQSQRKRSVQRRMSAGCFSWLNLGRLSATLYSCSRSSKFMATLHQGMGVDHASSTGIQKSCSRSRPLSIGIHKTCHRTRLTCVEIQKTCSRLHEMCGGSRKHDRDVNQRASGLGKLPADFMEHLTVF